MKILHITASYKPAYLYGGPIHSIGKLCEALVSFDYAQDDELGNTQDGRLCDALERNQDKRLKTKDNLQNNPPPAPFEEEQVLEVLTTTANGNKELNVEIGTQQIVDGVPVTYFKRWTKDHSHFSPSLLLHLNKVLRHFVKLNTGSAQHDKTKLIIHIHAWWNLVSVLSCLVAKWYNVPIVLSPRGMLNNYTKEHKNGLIKNIFHFFIGKKLLKHCYLHLTTEKEKNDLYSFLNFKKTAIIPNLVNLKFNDFIKKHEQNESISEHFKLLFLSRIDRIKGIELLFEALAELSFEWILTIAGGGEEDYIESLKRKAESLKLGKRIKWIGQVSNEEKFLLMANHNLLVLPSYNENFANVVVESLSVGTPVLVSENVGLADYVKANELGWICSLEPKDIANKINEAYIDVAKREKINSTAPTHIQNNFNDEVLVGRYLELYEQILHLRSE